MNSSTIDASNAMEFYSKNNVILLTGGSGFIGLALIEKILRSLPQVKKIYTLLRVSGKATLNDRFEQVVTNNIFDTLRSNYPSEKMFREKIASKIVPIQGDVSLYGLGMRQSDIEMVLSDTSIIIHCAATVRFDEPLHVAKNINTCGTLRLLNIAKRMPHLASFNHVSTAYTAPDGFTDRCMEFIHPMRVPGTPEEIFDKLSKMSKYEMELYEVEILKSYPNTYGFTKGLSENLIQSRYKELNIPLVITKPSIVCSAMNEPSVGWTQGLGSINTLVRAVGIGEIQEWIGNRTNRMDYVPIDFVCKTILAATVTADRTTKSPKIYNIGSTHNNGIYLFEMGKYIVKYWRSAPAPKKRKSNDIRCEFYPLEELNQRFNQKYGETVERAQMKNDHNTVKKIQWLYFKATMFQYYHTNPWIFDMTNSIQLDDTAPKELQSGLRFDIDWEDYMHRIGYGIHKYVLGELVIFEPKSRMISARF